MERWKVIFCSLDERFRGWAYARLYALCDEGNPQETNASAKVTRVENMLTFGAQDEGEMLFTPMSNSNIALCGLMP